MTLAELIYDLHDSEKKSIRRKERLQRKLIKAEYAVTFNKICINEKLLPSYTDIKQGDKTVLYEQFTLNIVLSGLKLN